jgi:hypothetical protein
VLLILVGFGIVWFTPNVYEWRGLKKEAGSVVPVADASRWVRYVRPAAAGILCALAVMGMTETTEFIYFNF